jgi:response regulator RpfG family c-di-GMP phosphodiesterase
MAGSEFDPTVVEAFLHMEDEDAGPSEGDRGQPT